MTRYSADERRQIAAGEFFTSAELAARPGLGRTIIQSAARDAVTGRVDPNTRPASAEARRMAASDGVCSWCHEPGDERSDLVQQADHGYRHPECQEARELELEA